MKIVILGAGFAGLSLAWHLIHEGVNGSEITLIDKVHPGAGASGVPGAMMHPVPGRSLAPKPSYLECYHYSKEWLDTFSKKSQTSFIKPIKLWRGAFDTKTAERFHRSFEKSLKITDYQKLVKRIPPSEQPSYLGSFESIYQVDPAFHINTLPLLQALEKHLKQAGVHFIFNIKQSPSFKSTDSEWQVNTTDNQYVCQHLVLSLASGLPEYFPSIPLDIIRGEVLLLEHPEFQSIDHAISSRGYITPMGNHLALAGSSFYPADIPYHSSQSISDILNKAQQMMPFTKDAKVLDIWSGQRTIFPPHREPLVGEVPNQKGLYILSAFATKGWLQIPRSSLELARLLTGKASHIPTEFLTNRLDASYFK